MKIKTKILSIFVVCMLFIGVLTVSASAESVFTEYYQYSGVAISDSVADKLQGYAVNFMSDYGYRYWSACRVGEYKYFIAFYNANSDFISDSTSKLLSGYYVVYDEHAFSYTTGTGMNQRTYYQSAFSSLYSAPCTVYVTRGYLIGNHTGTVGVNASQSDVNTRNLRYLLYTLVMFLFLYVAFQFIRKRWFIQ